MPCLLEKLPLGVVQGTLRFRIRASPQPMDDLLTCVLVSGYTCTTNLGHAQTCRSQAGYGDSFAIATCSNDGVTDFSTRTLPFVATRTVSGSITTNQVATYVFQNPMVEIRFRSSDLADVGSTLSDPSTSTRTSTSSALIESATATSSQTAREPSRLSTGAKAGIGVGVAVGALLMIGAAFMLWRKSQRSPTSQSNDINSREPQQLDTYP